MWSGLWACKHGHVERVMGMQAWACRGGVGMHGCAWERQLAAAHQGSRARRMQQHAWAAAGKGLWSWVHTAPNKRASKQIGLSSMASAAACINRMTASRGLWSMARAAARINRIAASKGLPGLDMGTAKPIAHKQAGPGTNTNNKDIQPWAPT